MVCSLTEGAAGRGWLVHATASAGPAPCALQCDIARSGLFWFPQAKWIFPPRHAASTQYGLGNMDHRSRYLRMSSQTFARCCRITAHPLCQSIEHTASDGTVFSFALTYSI